MNCRGLVVCCLKCMCCPFIIFCIVVQKLIASVRQDELKLSVKQIRNKLDTLHDGVKKNIFIYNYNADEKEWKAFEKLITTQTKSIDNATCFMILLEYDETRIENCVKTCLLDMEERGLLRADLKTFVIIYNEDNFGEFDDEGIADLWHA